MIRAVLFDFDGLMADSEPLAEWAWNQVLTPYGHRLNGQILEAVLGLRVIDTSRFLCRHFDLPLSPEEAMAERERVFLDAVPAQLRACDGLYPLLDELAARGVPLAVATSGHRGYITLALETLGVADRFQALATGDEVANGKPAPDVYLLAAQRLDVPPAACLVLEDAPLGIASARAAGMACVAVPNPRLPPDAFGAANWVFPSLAAVLEHLDTLIDHQEHTG
ncbi:MAG: HAD family phosphatase [Anaerolineae bacterium]|nr:HAD family phosphatase [Anaerolineae bacterium]